MLPRPSLEDLLSGKRLLLDRCLALRQILFLVRQTLRLQLLVEIHLANQVPQFLDRAQFLGKLQHQGDYMVDDCILLLLVDCLHQEFLNNLLTNFTTTIVLTNLVASLDLLEPLADWVESRAKRRQRRMSLETSACLEVPAKRVVGFLFHILINVVCARFIVVFPSIQPSSVNLRPVRDSVL